MRGSILATAAILLAVGLSVPVPAQRLDPKTSVKTADYEFNYTYPAKALAIPTLAAYFETERAHARAMLIRDATEARQLTKRGGTYFNPFDTTIAWHVVAETPRLLSLSRSFYSFTGGAHGNTRSGSMVWDKARRARLKPDALFVTPDTLWAAIRQPYCRTLDEQRAKRRGQAVNKSGDPFDACPPLRDLTLLLGSSNRKAIDCIGLIADPYVAGSFAEGQYEIALPVTRAVIGTVKPAYRAAFALPRR